MTAIGDYERINDHITVVVDNRKFIVDFTRGRAVRIKQRKKHQPGTIFECYYNAPYWNAKHHPPGSPKSIVGRILKAARQQLVVPDQRAKP